MYASHLFIYSNESLPRTMHRRNLASGLDPNSRTGETTEIIVISKEGGLAEGSLSPATKDIQQC